MAKCIQRSSGSRAGRHRDCALRECRTGRPSAARSLAEGKTGPEWHEASRPESVEAEGTHRFATFLENTGATGYVVHLRASRARKRRWPRRSGASRFRRIRASPFLLDNSYAERPGVEGMKHVMSPPLRRCANHSRSVERLASAASSIQWARTIVPSTSSRRCWAKMLSPRFRTAFPGIEERVNLLYTYGVKRGKLDLHRFVDAASTRRREVLRALPAKGSHRRRQRCRSGDLRPDVSRRDLGQDAPRQQRLQRL